MINKSIVSSVFNDRKVLFEAGVKGASSIVLIRSTLHRRNWTHP